MVFPTTQGFGFASLRAQITAGEPVVDRSQVIRRLNDNLRTAWLDELGRVVFSDGVASLDDATRRKVCEAVQTFDNFTADNDPYGEHDFGKFEVDGEDYFFKIDYFDKSLKYASPDPANAFLTCRVLTIMQAWEY